MAEVVAAREFGGGFVHGVVNEADGSALYLIGDRGDVEAVMDGSDGGGGPVDGVLVAPDGRCVATVPGIDEVGLADWVGSARACPDDLPAPTP